MSTIFVNHAVRNKSTMLVSFEKFQHWNGCLSLKHYGTCLGLSELCYMEDIDEKVARGSPYRTILSSGLSRYRDVVDIDDSNIERR